MPKSSKPWRGMEGECHDGSTNTEIDAFIPGTGTAGKRRVVALHDGVMQGLAWHCARVILNLSSHFPAGTPCLLHPSINTEQGNSECSFIARLFVSRTKVYIAEASTCHFHRCACSLVTEMRQREISSGALQRDLTAELFDLGFGMH